MLTFENIEVYIDIFKEVSTRVYRVISTGDFKDRKVGDLNCSHFPDVNDKSTCL